MKKIICIGECALDVIFEGDRPVGAMPGGRIVNAAAILARDGMPVVLASEAAADPVGDRIVRFASEAGIDISSMDRFTEGRTPLNLYIENSAGEMSVTRYEDYSKQGFDIIWPRVDEGDIVVFGGYYALDERMRTRMLPFLNHCAEMHAVMVYLPGFLSTQVARITRVMPAILENLEMADIVIARSQDLELIFGLKSGEKCYADHVDFYCRSMVNVDPACRTINYYSGKDVTHAEIPEKICTTLTWNAGVVAGAVAALYQKNITAEQLNAPGEELRMDILSVAVKTAATAANSLTEKWQLR